jgi:2-hydroxychromene-2-carboxylate isomerase
MRIGHLLKTGPVRTKGGAATLAGMFAAALLLSGLAQSLAQRADPSREADYPLVGDEGQRLPNHRVRLLGPIDRIPGVVAVGNPAGKKVLTEFYDLNCPYCRLAAADISAMVERDDAVKLVLVPFPILGAASIGASRVELSIAKLGTPQQFYDFHRRIYAQRGKTDGPRALEVARGLGFDAEALMKLGNSDEITQTMKDLVGLGNTLGLMATPSFIIANVAVLGYPGPRELQTLVDAAATCGKVVC